MFQLFIKTPKGKKLPKGKTLVTGLNRVRRRIVRRKVRHPEPNGRGTRFEKGSKMAGIDRETNVRENMDVESKMVLDLRRVREVEKRFTDQKTGGKRVPKRSYKTHRPSVLNLPGSK